LVWGKEKKPRRILLVRNDGIGDLVLTLPAMTAIRRQFPDAHLTALLGPGAAGLLDGSRLVDFTMIDDPSQSHFQLAARLRQGRFDTAVVFNSKSRNCRAMWLAGIPTRVCWGYTPLGMLLGNRRIFVHRSRPPIHESAFCLEFARRLEAQPQSTDFAPQLAIDTALRDQIASRIAGELGTAGPLFGVHPGDKGSAYNWPASHYAELAIRLARVGRVIITGKQLERPLLEQIRSQLSDETRKRVGLFWNLDLLELAAVIEQQTALTVGSTGPMHVAGIVGTKVVALFSPHPCHSPKKWAPLGDGHTLLVAPLHAGEDPYVPRNKSAAVMARISVEQVLEANLRIARESLGATAAREHAHGNIAQQAA
jgi:ADP-heptose:LPS heptosyltransferase